MLKSLLVFTILASCPLLVAGQAPTSANTSIAPTQQATTSPAPSPSTLLDGTPIKLRSSQTISSADARVGQEIPFEVNEEITVDGIVVLPKGATAIGTVTEADHKKSMGRAGKLNISITYARLADQEKVALRAIKDSKGGGHVGAMTGAIVATSIVFFPAAPLFLFIHGKDITIPQGTEITAFVAGDMHLDMARFAARAPLVVASDPLPNSALLPQARVVVDSNPVGADIEVDGGFMGNTPSTITLALGSHQIVVKKKGFADWTKSLNVTGGDVHLNAGLELVSGQ